MLTWSWPIIVPYSRVATYSHTHIHSTPLRLTHPAPAPLSPSFGSAGLFSAAQPQSLEKNEIHKLGARSGGGCAGSAAGDAADAYIRAGPGSCKRGWWGWGECWLACSHASPPGGAPHPVGWSTAHISPAVYPPPAQGRRGGGGVREAGVPGVGAQAVRQCVGVRRSTHHAAGAAPHLTHCT